MSKEQDQGIRILILEDIPANAELLERELRKKIIQFSSSSIETRRAFLEEFGRFSPHIVLGDYRLTSVDGLNPLTVAGEKYTDISVIFTSAAIHKDLAINSLTKRTIDNILKDRLSRLVPAANRAIGQVEERNRRKRAVEALEALNSRYQAFFATIPDIIMEVNANKTYTWANQAGYDFYGEDVIGKEADSYFEGQQSTYKAVQPLFGGGEEVICVESWQRRRDGQMRLLASSWKVLKDEKGNVTGALSSARDITESKRAEEALRGEREKLQLLSQNVGAGLAIISKDYRTLWANKVLKDLYGDVEGKTCYSTYNRRAAICPGCGVQEIFERGAERIPHEQVGKDVDGNTIWAQIIATPLKDKDGNTTAALELVIPITERKRAEEALRLSEEKYRTLVTQSPDGIFIVDLQGNFSSVNRAMCEKLRFSEREFLSMKIWDIVPEEYVELHKKRLVAILRGETPNQAAEYVVRGKDEKTHFIEVLSAPHIRENKVIGFQGIARDITNQKHAENALRESEEYFRRLTKQSPVPIAIIGDKGEAEFLNERFIATFGYTLDDLPDLKAWWPRAYPDEEYRREVIADWENAVKEAETTAGDTDPHEYRITCKNGTIRVAEILGSKIGNKILILLHDITERKEMADLQEQLRQSQKMEAIGRLAGGIAHDFNNLLTVISGYSELSLDELQIQDPLRANIEEILKAGQRASELTRQLLAFSRRQLVELKVVDLNSLLLGMEKMLRRMISESIELTIYPGENLGGIKADPGQVEQVILNLVVNSKDAMPSGGKIILETANVGLDEGFVHSHVGSKPGDYVWLSVTDTGCGMAKEVKDRIFEPFFTTKEKGKGTGLGLSTVYGIVKQSGGYLWVSSEPGKGTCIEVYLPRTDEVAETFQEEVKKERVLQGNETILVVEDEEMLRKLIVQALRSEGYKVLQALHGGDALLACERHLEPIHLIVTDVVMPGMGGPELIERLRQVRQDFKVLYMSGYTDESDVHHEVLGGELKIVQKPFSMDVLARRVRKLLDE
jgi:PAS domain S-box-containing protein